MINALYREASFARALGEWTRLRDEEAKLDAIYLTLASPDPCVPHDLSDCPAVCPSRTPVRDEIALKEAWRRAASRPTPSLTRVNAMIEASQRHD